MSYRFVWTFILPPLFLLCFGIWAYGSMRIGEDRRDSINWEPLKEYFLALSEHSEEKFLEASRLGVNPADVLTPAEGYAVLNPVPEGELSFSWVRTHYEALQRLGAPRLPPLLAPGYPRRGKTPQ